MTRGLPCTSLASAKRIERHRGKVQASWRPPPPIAAGAPLREAGEGILIERGPDVPGGMIRERIVREQRRDDLRAFEQSQRKREKPRILVVAAERREPHLPVEPRLVGLDERWRPRQVAGLPFELVRAPCVPIVASFYDDLGTARRHHREEAVAVDDAERSGHSAKDQEWLRPIEPERREREHLQHA